MKNISLIVSFVMGLFGKSATVKQGKSLLDLVQVLRAAERSITRRLAQGAGSCPAMVVELLYDQVAVSRRDRWAVGLSAPKFVAIESLDDLQRMINSILKIEAAADNNGGYPVVYGWNFMIVPTVRGEQADSLLTLITQREARFQALMAKPTSDEEKARALADRQARIAKHKESATG